MEQKNSLQMPLEEEWYPYIKPTRHKHESGFYCFEVGYCQVGSEAQPKNIIRLGGIPPDHICTWEFKEMMGGMSMDLLKGGYMRFFSHSGLHWLGSETGSGRTTSSMMLKAGWPQINNLNSLT